MNLVVRGVAMTPRSETAVVNLAVSEETLQQDGPIRWQVEAELADSLTRQEGVTVRSAKSVYPYVLAMDPGDARAALVSEEPATAEVDLPLRAEVQEGREFVRDADGRAQGAVETRFVSLAWDRSQVPA